MTLTGNPVPIDPCFDTPPSNPLILLQKWLQAAEILGVNEPSGLVLSTISSAGKPSSRVVLLKDCDEKGIVFSSSQDSAKGKDLAANPFAAGTLWWRETIQQVNFSGPVTKLAKERADKLFQERTREAKGVASLSKQSKPLANEKELRSKILTLINSQKVIDRPKNWHAYHLAIESIEFWQGSPDRFHKRLRYDLIKGSWQSKLLQP